MCCQQPQSVASRPLYHQRLLIDKSEASPALSICRVLACVTRSGSDPTARWPRTLWQSSTLKMVMVIGGADVKGDTAETAEAVATPAARICRNACCVSAAGGRGPDPGQERSRKGEAEREEPPVVVLPMGGTVLGWISIPAGQRSIAHSPQRNGTSPTSTSSPSSPSFPSFHFSSLYCCFLRNPHGPRRPSAPEAVCSFNSGHITQGERHSS